jgi:hypothetical protein
MRYQFILTRINTNLKRKEEKKTVKGFGEDVVKMEC